MAEFMEQAMPFGIALLIVLGACALVALIVVLVRAAKTMGHVNAIAAQAEKDLTPALKRVDPLIDRAELTVDTVNLELLRVDAILEDVEQITNVAGNAADTVNTLTSAPTNAVASIAEKIRGALGSKHREKAKAARIVYPIGPGSQPAADQDAPDADMLVDVPESGAEAPVADVADASDSAGDNTAADALGDDTAADSAGDDPVADTPEDSSGPNTDDADTAQRPSKTIEEVASEIAAARKNLTSHAKEDGNDD